MDALEKEIIYVDDFFQFCHLNKGYHQHTFSTSSSSSSSSSSLSSLTHNQMPRFAESIIQACLQTGLALDLSIFLYDDARACTSLSMHVLRSCELRTRKTGKSRYGLCTKSPDCMLRFNNDTAPKWQNVSDLKGLGLIIVSSSNPAKYSRTRG